CGQRVYRGCARNLLAVRANGIETHLVGGDEKNFPAHADFPKEIMLSIKSTWERAKEQGERLCGWRMVSRGEARAISIRALFRAASHRHGGGGTARWRLVFQFLIKHA